MESHIKKPRIKKPLRLFQSLLNESEQLYGKRSNSKKTNNVNDPSIKVDAILRSYWKDGIYLIKEWVVGDLGQLLQLWWPRWRKSRESGRKSSNRGLRVEWMGIQIL